MSELVTLTPAARPRQRVPRWALIVLALAFVADVVTNAKKGLNEPFVVIGGITSAVTLAVWLESRIYVAFSRLPALVHWIITVTLAPAGLMCGTLGAMILGIFGGHDVAVAPFVAGVWFSSAVLGTATVQFVDLFARVFASKFSTRIVVTVFGLIMISALASTAIVISVPRLVHIAMEKAPDSFKIQLDDEKDPMTGSEFSEFVKKGGLPSFLQDFQADELIGWGLVIALFLLNIPALISASSKLGELAMERVHPLDLALERVAKGDLDVRVEEAGSTEFKRLAQQFNRMVAALDIAQRMERAFGAYVSRPVLNRIRAQHGAIALPSVQKEATVFFADVRGFTAISEKLTPDRVLDILNRYYGYAVGIVEAHEGYLDKFIGDAMYVIFNGPLDQPDHVERAVKCAIALQEKILILNASGAFPEIGSLEVGIGVATGPVVAGNVGTERSTAFSVIGDTVNLASRLCSNTPAGEVWISARTAEALPNHIRSTALEPLAVKGKANAVLVHRVFPEPTVAEDEPTPMPRRLPETRHLPEEHRDSAQRFLMVIADCEERGLIQRSEATIVREHVLRLGERGMNPANTGNLEDLFVHTLSETRDPVRAFAQVLGDSLKIVPPPASAELFPPIKRISDGARFTHAQDLPLDGLGRMLVGHTTFSYADSEMREAALSMLRAHTPALMGEELDRAFHRMVLESQHLPSSAYVLAKASGLALDVRDLALRGGVEANHADRIQTFYDVCSRFKPEWLLAFRSGAAPEDPDYLQWKNEYRTTRAALPDALVYQLYTDTLTNFGGGTMASGKWIDTLVRSGEAETVEDVPIALAKVVRGYQLEWIELHGNPLSTFNAEAGPHLARFGILFDEKGAPIVSGDRPPAWDELVHQWERARR